MASRNRNTPPAPVVDDEGTVTDALVVGADAPQTCACGCGEALPPRPVFVQGHDARLKGLLFKAHRADQPVLVRSFETTPVVGEPTTAQALLEERGWPLPAEKKSKAKAEADTEEAAA